ICDRVDKISVLESVDSSGYNSPETEIPIGFTHPITNPDLPNMVRKGTAVFEDAVYMMADALGVELDDVVLEAGLAAATRDVDLPSLGIREGGGGGGEGSGRGRVAGRTLIDLRVRWRKGQHIEPDWPLEHGSLVQVEGQPCVRTKLEIRPPRGFVG